MYVASRMPTRRARSAGSKKCFLSVDYGFASGCGRCAGCGNYCRVRQVLPANSSAFSPGGNYCRRHAAAPGATPHARPAEAGRAPSAALSEQSARVAGRLGQRCLYGVVLVRQHALPGGLAVGIDQDRRLQVDGHLDAVILFVGTHGDHEHHRHLALGDGD